MLLYMLHSEDKNMYLTDKVRTFLTDVSNCSLVGVKPGFKVSLEFLSVVFFYLRWDTK